MILTGLEIKNQYEKGHIKFSEFEDSLIDTNSYNLRLGNTLLKYDEDIIDPKKENKYHLINIPEEGLYLPANSFVLAETSIKLGSDFFVPMIHGKSSTARMGMFVHITADLIDIGFYGKSTLQLHNLLPIILYPNMPIAQVTFWKPKGEISLYNGKYQNAEQPISSKIFKDF